MDMNFTLDNLNFKMEDNISLTSADSMNITFNDTTEGYTSIWPEPTFTSTLNLLNSFNYGLLSNLTVSPTSHINRDAIHWDASIASTKGTNDSSTIQEDWEDIPLIYSFSQDLMLYCILLIIPLGLICNTFSISIFMMKRMRKRATSWYLSALAVSDNVSLVTVLFDYCLKNPRIGLDIVKHSHILCVLISHLSYASRLLSAMLITSFTVERFIGVVYPLKRAGFSCPVYVRKIIAIEASVCLLLTSYTIFTIGVVDLSYGRECDVIPERATVYFIMNIIIQVFGSIIIPIILICSLNLYIMYTVYRKHKYFIKRKVSFGSDKPLRYRRNSNYNVATLLLVVAMTFVVLNLPYCITWFLLFAHHYQILKIVGKRSHWYLFAAKYITSIIYYINYAINFVLYNMCAKSFRVDFIRMVTCSCKRRQRRRSPLCVNEH